MTISIDKTILEEALTTASRFVSNKLISSPILQGVLIESTDKNLSFSATNLSSYFKASVKSAQNGTFKTVVEPKKISEFLSFLAPGRVTLELDDKKIAVSQGKTQGVFQVISPSDFPQPPQTKKEDKKKIKTNLLTKNLPLVLFAASRDEARAVLTGVNFVTQDEEMLLVTTDGFRMSLLKLPRQAQVPPMLVPADFLDEVLRFVKDEEEVGFEFLTKEKMIAFYVGGLEFYSRLIDGEFPPYEKVIPEQSKTKAVLDKDEFLKNVKLTSVFARDFSNIIICEFKKDGLEIRPKIDGEDQNKAYQEADVTGESQMIAFNFRFVIDFLNHVEGKKVIVEVLRPDAPAVFKVEGQKDFLHIIMPVRIQT